MQVTELYDRWENGMDSQKPLKKLAPNQYRCYRTRYHEIKNFIFELQQRARMGEEDGDTRKVMAAFVMVIVHDIMFLGASNPMYLMYLVLDRWP